MKLSEIRALIDAAIQKYGDVEALESHNFGDPTPIGGLYVNHAIFDRDRAIPADPAALVGPKRQGCIDFAKVEICFRRQHKESK